MAQRNVKITTPEGNVLTKKTGAAIEKNVVMCYKIRGEWKICSVHTSMAHAASNAADISNKEITAVHWGQNEA